MSPDFRDRGDLAPARRAPGFSELLRSAARAEPRLEWSPPLLTLGEIDALADHYAARLSEAEPADGATALLAAAPTAQSFAAMIGALRAGVGLALAPPDSQREEFAAIAARAGCALAIGPVDYAGVLVADNLFRAAADVDGIRLAALHGGRLCGALALDAACESEGPFVPQDGLRPIHALGPPGAPPLAEPQETLVEAAATLVALQRIGAGATLLTTVSPASAAGLVAGPLAALVADARLVFHAPFDLAGFEAALAAAGLAHLVLPADVAALLAAERKLPAAAIASLTLTGQGSPAVYEAIAATVGGAPLARLFAHPLSGGLRLEPIGATSAGNAPEGGLGDGRAA